MNTHTNHTPSIRNPLRTHPEIITAGVLGFSLLCIFTSALPPDIVWGDSPELAAAAFSLGNPHPTGYSLYMLLLHAFQWLPWGSIAFRSHLFSAVSMAAAASLWMRVLTRFAASAFPARRAHPICAALTAALAFALTPIAWSQAVTTEVYAFFILLCTLQVYLLQRAWHNPWAYAFPVLCIASAQILHHRIGIFLTVTALLIWLHRCIRHMHQKPHTLSILKSTLLGLSPFLLLIYFPVRASFDPFINWYNPLTPARFWNYINGEMYQTILQTGFANARFILTPTEILSHLFLTFTAYSWLSVIIAMGWAVLFYRQWRLGCVVLMFYSMHLLFLMFYKVGDWQVFLLPLLFIQTIPLGFAVCQMLDWTASTATVYFIRFTYALFGVLACLPWFVPHEPSLFHLGLSRPMQQRELKTRFALSRDTSALEYADQVWDQVQPGDSIITGLDQHTADNEYFPLLYQHVVLQKGGETPLISANFLRYDWYRQQINRRYGLSLPMKSDRIYPSREAWLRDLWTELIQPLLQRGGVVTPSPRLAADWYDQADVHMVEMKIPRAVVPQSYQPYLPGSTLQRFTRKPTLRKGESP